MLCTCDYCDSDVCLDDATEETDGKIICSNCEYAEEVIRLGSFASCRRCQVTVRKKDLVEKIDGGVHLCVHCAHIYELKLFVPPDHRAEECALCIENKKRGMKWR